MENHHQPVDEERFTKNLFRQVDELWVKPEIEKRRKSGDLPKDFVIRQCLVRLPPRREPIVEFNSEIGWIVKAKASCAIEKGTEVYLHHVANLESVDLPRHDGRRCAYVYFYIGFDPEPSYRILFDLKPNHPEFDESESDDQYLQDAILESLRAILFERTIRLEQGQGDLLRSIGLWPAPALLPYPLSKILHHLREKDSDAARSLLKDHCDQTFIKGIIAKWWEAPEFAARRPLIEQAIQAHFEGKFGLSVSALMPHVEGTVSDYIHTRHPEDMPWGQGSKVKKFKDLVLEGPPPAYVLTRLVEATIDFILEGPVLASFKKWDDTVSDTFPNRHLVQHGKYEETHFNEENSLKLILLLDSIYYLLSKRPSNDTDA